MAVDELVVRRKGGDGRGLDATEIVVVVVLDCGDDVGVRERRGGGG